MAIGLAQFNVARLLAPPDDPSMQQFIAGLQRINRLADLSPGFVWRLDVPSGHPTGLDGDAKTFVNLSVWESYGYLHDFVYRSNHSDYLRQRNRWFERLQGPTTVLWWIDLDELPSLRHATTRLRHLRHHGSTPRAFSPLHQFDPAGRVLKRPRPPTSPRTSPQLRPSR